MRALVCKNKYKPLDPPAPTKPARRARRTARRAILRTCEPVKTDSRFFPEAWTRVGEYHFDSGGNPRNWSTEPTRRGAQRLQGLALLRQGALQAGVVVLPRRQLPRPSSASTSWWSTPTRSKAETGAKAPTCASSRCSTWASRSPRTTGTTTSTSTRVSGLSASSSSMAGESRGHVKEIYGKLGDVYFDKADFPHAINAYKRTLTKWPFDPNNPKLQDCVVMAFERQRDFGNALKAREELAHNYTKGTERKKRTATTPRPSRPRLIAAAVSPRPAGAVGSTDGTRVGSRRSGRPPRPGRRGR